MATKITVKTHINSSISKVWEAWSTPADIQQWCSASPDWFVPYAENDLRVNGRFKTVMSSRDGSMSFDFEGVYTEVTENKKIAYEMPDGRKVEIEFSILSSGISINETFEAEDQHPVEMQEAGWQSILNNFKTYVEEL